MKIGELVKLYIEQIFEFCEKNDLKELKLLMDNEYSKSTFNLQFPFCSEVSNISEKNSKRYWKATYKVLGKTVRVSSQWYDINRNNSRLLFLKYLVLKGIISKKDIDHQGLLSIRTENEQNSANHRSTNIPADTLFEFKDNSPSVERDIAILLGKVSHHIHPKIVGHITEVNVEYQSQFEEICHDNCDVSAFFYPKSDCVFPGFRRPINQEMTPRWKNNVREEDGTVLNDNTFPRHIWAYLAMNCAYSGGAGGMWTSSGLSKFELAHVFAHKTSEIATERKVFQNHNQNVKPYGMFTSASNVVLIPKGLTKPTDKSESVKICFYKRHFELYGNNLNGFTSFIDSKIPDWYPEIKWLKPILPDDWRLRIDNLLKYRKNYLERKYTNLPVN
jgi:hypothetical protein